MRLWLVILGLLPILLVGSGPGAVASTPALPPHNGLIAVNGWDGIYMVDPQTGTTRLVPKTLEMSEAAWSPDGTTLALTMPYGESYAVFTMKPDGSERKLVLANAFSPSWSPDGKELVVVRGGQEDGDGGNELAIVGADGGDARTLDLGPREVAVPEWSPDGKLIAFVDVREGVIALVGSDGEAAARPVVQADATGISWSPDSTRLAFDHYVETKEGGRAVVVVLDIATGKQRVFAGEQHGARSPTWSPEGDQIAFLSTSKRSTTTTTTTTSHSCGGEDFVSQLWVMSPEGTKAHKLVEGEYYGPPSWARALETVWAPPADREQTQPPLPAPPADTAPEPAPAPPADTAPDQKPLPAPAADEAAAPEAPTPAPAKRLASSASTEGLIAVRGSVALYLVDPAGVDTRKIPDTSDMVAPAWSPDAKLLAVERIDKATSSIWTIRPDGTDPRLVLPNASLPSWSPAGDLIYAVRNECATRCEPEDEAANVLFSVRPDGTDVQRVDPENLEAADGRDFRWAPDGDAIGFFADELESNPGTFDSSEAAWSPDEMYIAFVGALGAFDEDTAAAPPQYGLWVVSAEGGTPQLLLEGASGRPSWAPR